MSQLNLTPTIGDIFSNRYLKLMFKIPNYRDIYQPLLCRLRTLSSSWALILCVLPGLLELSLRKRPGPNLDGSQPPIAKSP